MNREQALAISRLHSQPDFQSLLDVFKDGLARADRQNREREGVQLSRSQGMSVLLEEIVLLTETARKVLEAK